MSVTQVAPPPLLFMVRGEALTKDQFKAAADQGAKTKRATPDTFHKGWKVVGHSPAALAEAQRARTAEYEAAKRRIEHGKGGKPVSAWDERHWRMTAKKKPVRAKPYEVRDSAQSCAELAAKSGWLDVELVEVRRGEAA